MAVHFHVVPSAGDFSIGIDEIGRTNVAHELASIQRFLLPDTVLFGDLVIDSVKHEVSLSDEPVHLTLTEFKLLHYLVAHKGRAFTRHELLDAIVGTEAVIIDRNVDVHVATLRKKLGDYGRHILTIRGLGYKFREAPTAHAG